MPAIQRAAPRRSVAPAFLLSALVVGPGAHAQSEGRLALLDVATALDVETGSIEGSISGAGTLQQEVPRLVTEACGASPDDAAPASPATSMPTATPAVSAPPVGMVLIPAGTFSMGSPSTEEGRDSDETQHSVTLTGAFWMSTTEVTQDEWRTLMGTSPSFFTTCGGDCPVEQVSWLDAIAYANARSVSEGLRSCYEISGGVIDGATAYDCEGYRLPTEAEWEYAARGGTTGPSYGTLSLIAWTSENANGSTHPVAELTPNAYGVYDMLGNVWEWTDDAYSAYPTEPAIDPIGASDASYRVFRGAGCANDAHAARASARRDDGADSRLSDVGLRLVRSVR